MKHITKQKRHNPIRLCRSSLSPSPAGRWRLCYKKLAEKIIINLNINVKVKIPKQKIYYFPYPCDYNFLKYTIRIDFTEPILESNR